MRSTRAALLALVALGASGCGGESEPGPGATPVGPSSSSSGGGAGGAGGTGTAGGFGGFNHAGGGHPAGGAGGVGLQPAFGAIPLVEAPDTPCEPLQAAPTQLYDDEEIPGFDRIQQVGARRVASVADTSSGFVTFDAGGANPSAAPISLGEHFGFAAAEGTTIGLVADTGSSIVYRRYSADDAPLTGVLTVANELPGNLAIAGSGGQSLILWSSASTMRARVVDAAGAFAGPAFGFGEGTVDGYFSGSVTARAGGFAAVWTSAVGGVYVTSFARLGTNGVDGPVVELTSTTTPHRTTKVAKTASGYAVLFRVELQPTSPVVAVFDEDGLLLGSGYQLLGANTGFDLAVAGSGTDLAVVANRVGNQLELRTLDANATPVSPWICLDAPNDNQASRAGVDAEGAGYAVVYRSASQAEMLVEVDLFGAPL
jgi:hypothetical protein